MSTEYKEVLTYIINWNRVHDDVLVKESELLREGLPIKVVNSSEIEKPEWMNLGSDTWCYRQLFEVMKDAKVTDYEYISVLFGDIYPPDGTEISSFVKETKNMVNILPDCYVYSTSFTHDGWSYPPSILKQFNENVSWVCGVDTLYLTLHRDVYTFLSDFLNFFDNKNNIDMFKSGWAVDIVSGMYSIYNGKGIFRNLNSNLVHYENSGYSVGTAYEEMSRIVDDAILYMRAVLGYDESRLRHIHSMMMTQRIQYVYSYKDFYGVS